MHEYTSGEIIAIIGAIFVGLTNLVYTFKANNQSQTNGQKLNQQSAQLNDQDNQLRDIKDQTNGGYRKLQVECERLSGQIIQLQAKVKYLEVVNGPPVPVAPMKET